MRAKSTGVIALALSSRSLMRRARELPPMQGQDLTSFVTCAAPYRYTGDAAPDGTKPLFRVAVYDFGVKRSILENLRAAFRKGCFPHVRSTLPTNFCELSDARACATLRRCVDPREWVVSYWYARVAAAEAWLEAAHILPRGRTHMTHSDLNRERVAKARAWLLDGLSKKEIASRLAVSSSHLSHLLRRLGK